MNKHEQVITNDGRTTAIKHCSCTSPYQDRRYGLGRRVMNWARKAYNGLGGWRCTVCAMLTGK